MALAAVLTLGLGIGMSTAMFSIIDATLLKPLPFHDPDRILTVWETNSELGIDRFPASVPNLRDWRERNRVFESLAAVEEVDINLVWTGDPVHVQGLAVTPNWFQLFGLKPLRGRNFDPEETKLRGFHLAVISERLWREQFSADPQIVGRVVSLNGEPFEIIGVAASDYQVGRTRAELWTPFFLDPANDDRDDHRMIVIGRLQKGVTAAQAEQSMQTISESLAREYPDTNRGWTTRVDPLRNLFVETATRRMLILLFASVGFLLLIACTNIAGLQVSQCLGRQKELAMRSALGASRRRLVRQLLTESVLLSLLGALAGVLLAHWGLVVVRTLGPDGFPQIGQAGIDLAALAFASLACLVAAILSGIFPALRAARMELIQAVQQSAHLVGSSVLQQRSRKALVVGQLALSFVLLLTAVLLLQSFLRLRNVNPGFEPRGLVTATLTPDPTRYGDGASRTQFYGRVLERVQALPGVEQAGLSSGVPFDGFNTSLNVYTEDPSTLRPNQSLQTDWRIVSPGFFDALGLSMIEGRTFDQFDNETGRRVLVIDERMAHQLWPNETAIGKRLNPGGGENLYAVVGVVSSCLTGDLSGGAKPTMYIPLWQWWDWPRMTLAVRSSEPADAVFPAIREAVRSVDPDQPVYDMRTMNDLLSGEVFEPRLQSELLGLFAILALALAAVGVYGVVATSVVQRRGEIGIRMTLGAKSRDVFALILGQGWRMLAVGLVLGVVMSVALSRLLQSQLFDTTSTDPVSYLLATLTLGSVGLLASTLPAIRAARVDPVEALRTE